MKDCEYWIWLQNAYGTGAKIKPIIEYFGSARQLYQAGSYEWRISGIIDDAHIGRLTAHSPSESMPVIKACERNGWDIITPEDEEYPFSLRELSDFPSVLYACGDTDALIPQTTVAMVGTRKASLQGTKVAYAIAQRLSFAGMTVVSGGALGIDTAAHEGALSAGKNTVAVLGCGLGTDYLQANRDLRTRISRKGVLITEYQPFAQATRGSFPKRNRIISGMSLATVVVEAGAKSGSLITAKYALAQNRELFAVPGDLFSSAYSGTGELLQSGARPVFNAKEIVECFSDEFYGKLDPDLADEPFAQMLSRDNIFFDTDIKVKKDVKKVAQKEKISVNSVNGVSKSVKPLPDNASETAKKVYNSIDKQTDFDTVVNNSGLPVIKVLSAITELEMFGVIEVLPGRKYKKI